MSDTFSTDTIRERQQAARRLLADKRGQFVTGATFAVALSDVTNDVLVLLERITVLEAENAELLWVLRCVQLLANEDIRDATEGVKTAQIEAEARAALLRLGDTQSALAVKRGEE